jgi:hypothetical protein
MHTIALQSEYYECCLPAETFIGHKEIASAILLTP